MKTTSVSFTKKCNNIYNNQPPGSVKAIASAPINRRTRPERRNGRSPFPDLPLIGPNRMPPDFKMAA